MSKYIKKDMTKKCTVCEKSYIAKSWNQLKCNECKRKFCVICGKEFKGQGKVCSIECRSKKTKETNLKRYGGHPNSNKKVQEKRKKTCIKRYGVDHPLKTEEVQKEIQKTCIERYGVPYKCMLNHIEMISKTNKEFSKKLEENKINSEFEFKIKNRSYDLHILNTNILIEINPTYTHNSTKSYRIGKGVHKARSNKYHYNKTKLALDNGYQIINIFDWDDWDEVIENIKNNKLPKYELKIRKNFYNRKTKDRIIDLDQSLNEQDLISKSYVVIYDVI